MDKKMQYANVERDVAFAILGAVHMSRASPVNRANLSHENLYFPTT